MSGYRQSHQLQGPQHDSPANHSQSGGHKPQHGRCVSVCACICMCVCPGYPRIPRSCSTSADCIHSHNGETTLYLTAHRLLLFTLKDNNVTMVMAQDFSGLLNLDTLDLSKNSLNDESFGSNSLSVSYSSASFLNYKKNHI